jgi:phospholipid-binding lipoprotein MlaA
MIRHRLAIPRLASLLVLLTLALLAGCATGPNANPRDPFEPYNRSMTNFNDGLDRVLLKPVATAYVNVTPSPLRTGVTNFFGNLQDAWTFVNSVLQLRPQKAAESLTRVGVNTFFGFGGIFDLASELSIPRHTEDLGRTLGRWGVPSGPYVVLPLFGPSTVRDALTFPLETGYDPVSHIDPSGTRYAVTGLRLINSRSKFLRLGSLLDEASLDKYTFTRDAFLAKRNSDVARSLGKNQGDDIDKDDPNREPDVEPDASKVEKTQPPEKAEKPESEPDKTP